MLIKFNIKGLQGVGVVEKRVKEMGRKMVEKMNKKLLKSNMDFSFIFHDLCCLAPARVQ